MPMVPNGLSTNRNQKTDVKAPPRSPPFCSLATPPSSLHHPFLPSYHRSTRRFCPNQPTLHPIQETRTAPHRSPEHVVNRANAHQLKGVEHPVGGHHISRTTNPARHGAQHAHVASRTLLCWARALAPAEEAAKGVTMVLPRLHTRPRST